MSEPDLSPGQLAGLLRFTREVCADAGDMLRQARKAGKISVAHKPGLELVTDLDLAIDALFRQRINAAYPGHFILSEEGEHSRVADGAFCWIIDPLDGTANFASGLPHVAISAALAVGGCVQLGVVEAPFYGETFHAVKGHGAFVNGRRLAASSVTDPRRALVATGFPHDGRGLNDLVDRLKPILHEFGDVRRLAAPALDICWVADGRLAGFVDRLFVWDFAAAGLIAEEAGAITEIFDVEGSSDQRDYLAAAPGVYNRLRAAKLNGR